MVLRGVSLFNSRNDARFILCFFAIIYGESPDLTLYLFVEGGRDDEVLTLGIISTWPIPSLDDASWLMAVRAFVVVL